MFGDGGNADLQRPWMEIEQKDLCIIVSYSASRSPESFYSPFVLLANVVCFIIVIIGCTFSGSESRY
jgi:hypothetical protein